MYSVTFSKNAQTQLPLLRKSFGRFAEAENGLIWALSRKPFYYEKISKTNIRIAPVGPFIDKNRCSFAVKAFFELQEGNNVVVKYFETWAL